MFSLPKTLIKTPAKNLVYFWLTPWTDFNKHNEIVFQKHFDRFSVLLKVCYGCLMFFLIAVLFYRMKTLLKYRPNTFKISPNIPLNTPKNICLNNVLHFRIRISDSKPSEPVLGRKFHIESEFQCKNAQCRHPEAKKIRKTNSTEKTLFNNPDIALKKSYSRIDSSFFDQTLGF